MKRINLLRVREIMCKDKQDEKSWYLHRALVDIHICDLFVYCAMECIILYQKINIEKTGTKCMCLFNLRDYNFFVFGATTFHCVYG